MLGWAAAMAATLSARCCVARSRRSWRATRLSSLSAAALSRIRIATSLTLATFWAALAAIDARWLSRTPSACTDANKQKLMIFEGAASSPTY